MKINKLVLKMAFAVLCFSGLNAIAQDSNAPTFTELKLEARGDAIMNNGSNNNDFSLNGRYLNFHMGGNLNDKFSYYVRQRFIANGGSVKFFDNTDFLYLNYKLNKNWSFRGGKDALAVGGFEYDARPINEYMTAYYWDNFYCFQLGGSATWTSNDGNHKLMGQMAVSPYAYTGSPYTLDKSNRFSYNLLWMGSFGHVNTLWSVNMFSYANAGVGHNVMGNIALGTQVVYPRWNGYLDVIIRTQEFLFAELDYSIVSRVNVDMGKGFTLFAKGGLEYNDGDDNDFLGVSGLPMDIMSVPGTDYCFYGLGCEYRPERCKDVRLHAYIAQFTRVYHNNLTPDERNFRVNFGLTWDMNFLKHINK